ncbi:MAG: DUF4058 family protein [bacterium]|nr:DUF4058 family protein [bacterium]
MPIHANQNLYPGVNAHLNSHLQNETGGWIGFHNKHVAHIDDLLTLLLPEGYFSRTEQSLQIRSIDSEAVTEVRSQTRPDVTIYQGVKSSYLQGAQLMSVATPTAVLPIPETFSDPEPIPALVIYLLDKDHPDLGTPVTRIELLSPANKPTRSHYEQYILKREEVLKLGLRLVEVDYLHETAPILHNLANYAKNQTGAFPYNILVTDPRPTWEQGSTLHYGIRVDHPLPIINIPLEGADVVAFDFQAAYNLTYQSSRFFSLIVDYAEDPPAFDKYTPEDREKIRALLDLMRRNDLSQESQ